MRHRAIARPAGCDADGAIGERRRQSPALLFSL
jgi:hypothetical protein